MSYTPFVATSPRAIAGIGFQDKVFAQFKDLYPQIKFEMVWDFYKEKQPTLTDRQLAIIEKEQGDITYELNGERRYVECCFAMGSKGIVMGLQIEKMLFLFRVIRGISIHRT